MLGVFLDIEKAFAMVWRKGVLFKMDKRGFRGRMFNWVQGFLCGHTIQVCIGLVIPVEVDMENGTLQGSVIGLILFIIAINDLSTKRVKVTMFADDTAIWETGWDIVMQRYSMLWTVSRSGVGSEDLKCQNVSDLVS